MLRNNLPILLICSGILSIFVFLDGDDKKSRRLDIQVAWKELVEGLDDSHRPIAISRFLGFVEGTLGVRVPEVWERTIQSLSFDEQNRLNYHLHESYLEQFAGRRKNPFWQVTKGFRVDKDGQQRWQLIHIESGVQTPLNVDDQLSVFVFPNGDKASCLYMAVAFNGDAFFVAFCKNAPEEYPIARIEKNGTVTWTSTVACQKNSSRSEIGIASSNFFAMSCELVATEEQVAVFGASMGTVYLDTFELKSGTLVSRVGSGF